MTPNEYQNLAMKTNDGYHSERLNNFINSENNIENFSSNGKAIKIGDLINGAMGISGEAGEITDLVKKIVFHGHELDVSTLVKEIGDVCWYIAMLCHALNVDLEDVLKLNISKLKERYPDGFSEEASRNRK